MGIGTEVHGLSGQISSYLFYLQGYEIYDLARHVYKYQKHDTE